MAVEPVPSEGAAPAAPPSEPKMAPWSEQFPKEFREAHKELLLEYRDRTFNDFIGDTTGVFQKVKGGKGIIVPDEKSTPEERTAFHQFMNLPEKAEEYELKADEKLLNKDFLDSQRKYYFEHGYTKKQAQDDIQRLQATVKQGLDARAARVGEAEKNYKANLVQALKGDVRVAEETENLAKKFIRATFSEQTRQDLVDSGKIYDAQYLIDMANAQRRTEPRKRIDESGVPQYEQAPGAAPRGKFGDGKGGGYSTGWNEAFAENAGGKR